MVVRDPQAAGSENLLLKHFSGVLSGEVIWFFQTHRTAALLSLRICLSVFLYSLLSIGLHRQALVRRKFVVFGRSPGAFFLSRKDCQKKMQVGGQVSCQPNFSQVPAAYDQYSCYFYMRKCCIGSKTLSSAFLDWALSRVMRSLLFEGKFLADSARFQPFESLLPFLFETSQPAAFKSVASRSGHSDR